jgi:hypothetical protein
VRFAYHAIRVKRASWTDVAQDLGDAYGVWRGEIGWYTDEGAAMTAGDSSLHSPHIVELRTEHLESTVRPNDLTPPREDGIYAHRWFEVDSSDWEEFLALSEGAWPDFESTFGVRIVGLWRSEDAPAGRERALLITRYPSLAVWESSRPYAPGTAAGAEESRRRFLKRATLTQRTIVRVTRLV